MALSETLPTGGFRTGSFPARITAGSAPLGKAEPRPRWNSPGSSTAPTS